MLDSDGTSPGTGSDVQLELETEPPAWSLPTGYFTRSRSQSQSFIPSGDERRRPGLSAPIQLSGHQTCLFNFAKAHSTLV